MIKRRSNKKVRGKKKNHTSDYEKWLNYLFRTYGASPVKRKVDGYGAMLWRYGPSAIPIRIPTPKGPLKGAMLSTAQRVVTFNGSTGVNSSGSAPNISVSSATATLGAISFRLDDLNQSSTFSSLFDQYRIDRVHLSFRTRNSAATLFNVAAPNNSAPELVVVADFDDASAPSALTDLYQYDNCIIANSGDSIDVLIEPSITPSLYAAGAFSGYAVQGSEDVWIDVANTAVPVYGIKFGITPLQVSTTAVWAWDITATYVVSFRNIR